MAFVFKKKNHTALCTEGSILIALEGDSTYVQIVQSDHCPKTPGSSGQTYLNWGSSERYRINTRKSFRKHIAV